MNNVKLKTANGDVQSRDCHANFAAARSWHFPFSDFTFHFPSPLTPHPSSLRSGISLLEVLISMFVIMIGLVGVSSLVYVGRHEVQEGGRLDRAANLGRAAIKDIRIRGMLGPRFQPLRPDPAPAPPELVRSDVWAVGSVPLTPLIYNTLTGAYRNDKLVPNPPASTVPPPYVIDPLGVAAGYGPVFPYGAAVPVGLPSAPSGLIRLTLLPAGLDDTARQNLNSSQLQNLAEEVFRGQDDLVVPFKAGTQNPAEQQFYISNGARVKRQSTGEYSWLATVVPAQTSEFTNNLMTVSVAVFHKRKLGIVGYGEKAILVSEILPGSPLEVKLQASTEADLTVKAGQWLMLNSATPKNPMSSPPTLEDYRWAHKWYRIVGMSDVQPESGILTRRVSLAGADWNGAITSYPGLTGPVATAFIFDGIVGVYEKAMKLEGPSEWTNY